MVMAEGRGEWQHGVTGEDARRYIEPELRPPRAAVPTRFCLSHAAPDPASFK
jgi:hypothetical protein